MSDMDIVEADLSFNDVISELSIAYLHAIVSKAKMVFTISGRLEDNMGIDGRITANGKFGYFENYTFNVQLKATTLYGDPSLQKTISYSFHGIEQYNKLCSITNHLEHILVVLFLPENLDECMDLTPSNLILRYSAYYKNLRGASRSDNKYGITIPFNQSDHFTPDKLNELVNNFAVSQNRGDK